MRKFRISFVTTQDRLETLVGLLSNEVSHWEMTEIQPATSGNSQKKKQDWYVRASGAVLEEMRKHPEQEYFYKDFGSALRTAGLGPTCASSIISALCHDGKVKRTRRGYYKLV